MLFRRILPVEDQKTCLLYTSGCLADYQKLYRSYDRLQGGFIWEWYDHGSQEKEEDGTGTYRYGGNYGDFPTNGNFCIDGLLMPDRTPVSYTHLDVYKRQGDGGEQPLKDQPVGFFCYQIFVA